MYCGQAGVVVETTGVLVLVDGSHGAHVPLDETEADLLVVDDLLGSHGPHVPLDETEADLLVVDGLLGSHGAQVSVGSELLRLVVVAQTSHSLDPDLYGQLV